MSRIGNYTSPDLPSFSEIQAGGRSPELDGDRELIARAAGDLALYAHETALREAGAAFAQGAISEHDYTRFDLDARRRIIYRRHELGLGPRP